MSAAVDLTGGAAAPGYRARHTLPLRIEAMRQLRRRRTLLMGGVLAALPFILIVAFAIGAFLLGLLLESLLRRGPDAGRRRDLRLLFGTGVLGGFTTYSALAADSSVLLIEGSALVGVLYAVGSVVLGVLASWGGIVLARRIGGGRS